MASYGTIYEFRFDDINGDDVDIFIAKKNYTGSVTRRALGRTPILKRERSGNILGTSLEIYAECKVDGEFAQLYTSSADEFRVEVYKRQNLLWRGFVSPELYSEPDIAPPYDVQIIATDGLGELKDRDYRFYGKATLRNHIQHALAPTSLQGDITLISSLSWEDDTSANAPSSLLEMVTDLSHLKEESCYDVLQSILTSLNACITQQDGSWMVIRESDLYLNTLQLPPALFGSMTKAHWWPVGNMSIDIIPAKKEVSVVHENQYRENILPPISMGVAAGWEIGVGCYYSSAEGGWIVPPETGLSYRIDARQYPLQSNLLLRIKARCLAIEGRDDVSKLSVYMERDYAGSTTYLIRDYSPQEDRVIMRWHDEMMGYVYAWDAPFVEQDTEPAVHDLEILVPLSGETLAESLNIVIGNPYPSPYLLCIYSIELTQAEQTPGSRLTAIIANGAREKMNESKVIFSSSANPSLPDLQYGILRLDGGVVEWHTPATTAPDLLSFAARDLAMQVALPRMRYRGKLNVPSFAFPHIPVLFERDDTYYFLNTYSYDLLNSELEVELISIPNARVEIESETVTELPSSGGSTGGGGTSGGGGSDIVVDSAMSSTSTNPVQNKVIKAYVDDAEAEAKKYTDEKISQIEVGGGSITVDTEMSDTSENAVQNKVIKKYIDDYDVYLEGYAEGVANDAEAAAKKYTDEKIAQIQIGGGISQENADKRYIRKVVDNFGSDLTFAVADGIVGTDDEYYFLPEKAPSTALDSQILATKADIPEIDTSALATKDEVIEVEEVAAAAFNDLKGIIDNIPSVEVDAELSADSENAIQNKTVTNELNTKVDKVEGKQLSTEDFTTPLKEKLEGLSAFDPTEINNAIEGLQNSFDALVSGNTSAAIESFNEFVAFLSGITDTQTLAGIVASLEQMIAAKQDKINDLDTIRSGAAKGATAIQQVKTINGEEIVGEGNIEINVDTSTLATKEEVTNLINEVIDDEEVLAHSLNELNERVLNIAEELTGDFASKEEFDSALESLSQADTTNQQAISEVSGKVTTLTERVDNIPAELADDFATKEALETSNSNLTNEVIDDEEVLAHAINDLNARLEALTARIATLESNNA